MRCETCEQTFQDTAVKIYRGKKVCASCFGALTTSGVPEQNQHLQIIQTQHVVTTVCPECNAELHVDSRKCPRCGAIVQRGDRFTRASSRGFLRVVYIALGLFGLMMIIGSIGVGIEKQAVSNVLIGIPLGGVCLALSIWGYARTLTRPSKPL